MIGCGGGEIGLGGRDRCRTAAELLKRSCLIPEQAREATWPISGARCTGRGGGSVRGSSQGVNQCSHTAVFAAATATADVG